MSAPAVKYLCENCNWHGLEPDLLKDRDPFTKGGILNACPNCREICHLHLACDEPDCWERVSCGTPTTGGNYRWTCGEHRPKT